MGWSARTTSLNKINAAGKAFVSEWSSTEDLEKAIHIIHEWRAAHGFPLNTMQMRLRNKVKEVDRRKPFVSQRIKRLPAIKNKLKRFDTMRLSVMQDIGGCRAVVASNRQVTQLRMLYKSGRIRHKLEREKDYISEPKKDGYRSIHLVYRYHSDQSPQYNGQRIEIQLRSRLQHAWATAVETVDSFTHQGLKISSGEEEFERFFALMGSWIALREGTPVVPNTPETHRELIPELRYLSTKLNVVDRMGAFTASARYLDRKNANAEHHIIILDVDKSLIQITSFRRIEDALPKYTYLEDRYRDNRSIDVLLASVHNAKLRRAYPNYFADTKIFLNELERALNSRPGSI